MAHMIWEDKFVSVREPAWHRLGTHFTDPISPTMAAEVAGLLYDVEIFPLTIETPNGPLDTGLQMVGRIVGDELTNFGVASNFDNVMLVDVLPMLDDLATRYPLSAAGALRQGASVFMTFEVAAETEIAGEAYREYLTVEHSYTPGKAHNFIYSPVRVVCNNTLLAAEGSATGKIAVAHTAKSKARLDAGYIVSDAMAKASSIKKNLELLAQTGIAQNIADGVIEETYKRYKPTNKVDPLVYDLVGSDVMTTLAPENKGQLSYYNNLVDLTKTAYAKFNDEFPAKAGTAYAVLQAVTEVADWRKGKSEVGSLESAMVGAKAGEKKMAWQLLMELTK